MPTVPLPERPNLDQLRRKARELQREVRTGEPAALHLAGLDSADPEYPLHQAQRALARRYGFPSWPRLHAAMQVLAVGTWVPSPPASDETLAHRFLRLSCLTYGDDRPDGPSEAADLRARHPGLADTDVATAAVCADISALQRHLTADPAAATRRTGPHGWSPLMYLAYGRLDVGTGPTVEAAALLLDAGADPNDGHFINGLPTPFTVLTGVFGGGEADQPPHPAMEPLARLLLSRGAEPNDAQTVYNRMFGIDDDFLQVLLPAGLGRGGGGPWRRRLPEVLDPPEALVRGLLAWAVVHDQRKRVQLLAASGLDVVSPLAGGATPVAEALRNGHRELAAQLLDLGADPPSLDPVEQFIAAALAGDAVAVRAAPADVVAAARRARPALLVWAAAQATPDAVDLLVAAGFDVNALGRGDVPVEQPWQTALHTAVERGDAALVARLLEHGADPSVRDRRFDGTAAGWARHLGRTELIELLGG